MDGILNINKAAGITSFRVVELVRRLTGEHHSGHAGTLDPEATGVLPVCLGAATRVIEFLFDTTKTYRAEVELGITTDTDDATGKVLFTRDASRISRDLIEATLGGFRGKIMQTPPMFSAVKHKGKPLYELARSGIQVERKSRPAQIISLDIVEWHSPIITLNIVCGKGTYIRSLAHDLGEALGCGAHMKSLVRLRVGPFDVQEALTIPQLEEIARWGSWQQNLYPLDYPIMDFPALVINHEQQCKLVHGASIALETAAEPSTLSDSGNLFRVYAADGSFVGLVKYEADSLRWLPEKIFIKNCCNQSH